jgi:hypothetical protein
VRAHRLDHRLGNSTQLLEVALIRTASFCGTHKGRDALYRSVTMPFCMSSASHFSTGGIAPMSEAQIVAAVAR